MTPILNLLVALAVTVPTDNLNWPNFLAIPSPDQLAEGSIPVTWQAGQHVWQVKLPGKGQSSPVIWDGIAYVTSIEGTMKEQCCVTAVSTTTGEILWSKQFAAAHPIRSNYFQCRAASTPVADADGVVAFFETGNLVAFDRQGAERWQIDLQEKYGAFESTIGLAASLTQIGASVFALIDHEGESYLLAVDKQSGVEQWRTERFSRSSYSSPAVETIGGKPHIVCSSDGSVDGYDPTSGEQLWTFEDVGANSQNTPMAISDGLFLVGASPGMHDARENQARTSNFCIKVTPNNSEYEVEVLWRTDPKVMSHFASPMTYQGLAYWVTKVGIVHCYRVATGELLYQERLQAGQCWATPLGIRNRIYFFGKDGHTTVIAAGEKFEVMAENQLWEPTEAAANAPGAVASRRPSGGAAAHTAGPPHVQEDQAAALAQGENRFADPVQYAVVLQPGGFLIRSGEQLNFVGSGVKK